MTTLEALSIAAGVTCLGLAGCIYSLLGILRRKARGNIKLTPEQARVRRVNRRRERLIDRLILG